jgi:uncharacterized protein YndB with AHSA1/START domain
MVRARRQFLIASLAMAMAVEAESGTPGARTPLPQESKKRDGAEYSSFAYVNYIRAMPETVWKAFFDLRMQSLAWMGHTLESDWRVGSAWRMVSADCRIANSGEVLEIDPIRRLALTYRSDHVPEWQSEGCSHAIFELNPLGDATKFTVTHTIDRPASKLIAAAAASWPLVFSNLKSLIETGHVALTITDSVLKQVRSATQ